MATVPPPEKVRELLTDKKQTPAQHDANGDAFMADGRPSIAVMFYERTKSPASIQKILKYGVEHGDAFLLDWVVKVAPDKIDPSDWKRAGENALAAKHYVFARDCFHKGGDDARAGEAGKALDQILTVQK